MGQISETTYLVSRLEVTPLLKGKSVSLRAVSMLQGALILSWKVVWDNRLKFLSWSTIAPSSPLERTCVKNDEKEKRRGEDATTNCRETLPAARLGRNCRGARTSDDAWTLLSCEDSGLDRSCPLAWPKGWPTEIFRATGAHKNEAEAVVQLPTDHASNLCPAHCFFFFFTHRPSH
jgi:hypothetical protein